MQFKAFQDQLEEVADKEEENAPVVYRTQKLLYIYIAFCILWDRKSGRKQNSRARINTCCCYKHNLFVLLLD